MCYLIIAIAFTINYSSPVGALTRIGYWPAKLFAPKSYQPSVDIKSNGDSNSQVIVLGDSFSNKNIWQSYLQEKRKIDIQTYHFSKVGCLDNWLKYIIKKNNKKNKLIIIQVVEQSFLSLFRALETCKQKTIPEPLLFKQETIYPDKLEKNKLILDVNYLSKTIFNLNRIDTLDKKIEFSGVTNVEINNVNLFSNIKSNRMLYLSSESEKYNWKRKDLISSLKKIKKQQILFQNISLKLVILVIPDKSTQYYKYINKNKEGR